MAWNHLPLVAKPKHPKNRSGRLDNCAGVLGPSAANGYSGQALSKRNPVISYRIAEQRLGALADNAPRDLLKESRTGVEKESLRVNRDGGIAQTPHPAALGSALTNPYITTDYSEALLELITPPLPDIRQSLQFLCDTQKFVYDRLGDDEILWATSMPCVLAGESGIPIAQYGESNIGKMKHIYRRGLGYRYGRVMQVIAGVHFNYSLPDAFWPLYRQLENADAVPLQTFINNAYFGMIRNLQRFGWLIPYLFGASPAVCRSFMGEHPTDLPAFNANTYYEPYGTSLRMGDIGYQNKKEHDCGIRVCYDDIDAYAASLARAIATPCPDFEKIGVVVDGEYRQLNANLLQIENEYYSTIRPKQLLNDNEKPSLALKRRGVRYVELRSLDVNAYDPLGINEEQTRFLEAFLLFCLLHESPIIAKAEAREIDYNQNAAAHRGRDPALELQRQGQAVRLRDWASELCAAMQGVSEYLDAAYASTAYTAALATQIETVRDPDKTPSARMLAEMRANGEGFHEFALRMSQRHRDYYRDMQLNTDNARFFTEEVDRSLQRQREIEAEDTLSFDEYLQRYFTQS